VVGIADDSISVVGTAAVVFGTVVAEITVVGSEVEVKAVVCTVVVGSADKGLVVLSIAKDVTIVDVIFVNGTVVVGKADDRFIAVVTEGDEVCNLIVVVVRLFF